MKYLFPAVASACLLYIAGITFASCTDAAVKTQTIDTLTAGKSRKGVIWDKKKVVQIPISLEENNMKGRVKTVTYTKYKFLEKNGGMQKLEDANGYNVYNESGYLVDQNEYYAGGKPRWKCLYRYNSNNRPVEWHFKFFDRNDEYKTTFEYDEKGNNIGQTVTNTKSERSEKILLRYDEKGNEIEEISLDGSGMMKRATISTYDHIGNQVMHISVSSHGDTTFQLTAKYDSNAYKIAGAIYMDGKLATKWKQKNDDYGRPVERQEYNPSGMLTRKTRYRHDSLGNVLELMHSGPGGNTSAGNSELYQYRYDSIGNVTEETGFTLVKGMPQPQYHISYRYSYY